MSKFSAKIVALIEKDLEDRCGIDISGYLPESDSEEMFQHWMDIIDEELNNRALEILKKDKPLTFYVEGK